MGASAFVSVIFILSLFVYNKGKAYKDNILIKYDISSLEILILYIYYIDNTNAHHIIC